MASLMRGHDWSSTALGPVESWPQSLRIVLRLLLTSRYAMWMGWGPELTFFYNDAYRPTLGVKHSRALGASARKVWAEIWHDIGPRVQQVFQTGVATWDEGLRLFLERSGSGSTEETYHTFSYSPLFDDAGSIGGMLCVVTEDTERAIGSRRTALLREVAAGLATTRTQDEVAATIAQCIEGRQHDLPFTLTYLFDQGAASARLLCATGFTNGHPAASRKLAPDQPGAPWPVDEIRSLTGPRIIDDLASRFEGLPRGPWDQPPAQAIVVPLARQGQEGSAGFLVAGLNPYRPPDADYQGFVELIAGQMASGIANARAYEEQKKRAEALAELDRAKTIFFSNVSHEFRTPLTLMLGPIEDALVEPVEPRQRERLTLLHRNALRLQKLVNTLLDFSRIEAGRIQAVYEPTDLARLTTELTSVFRSAVERAGLHFHVDCPPLAEPVYVDRDMWEKIVLNLVSNAFKFTLEGQIAIRLFPQDRAVILTIRDTGTGISAEQLPHIFERFHRVEGARARTHEGTGIGLALVQELVKLHGGSVEVDSVPGRGTEFRVAIPLGSDHLPPERIGAARPVESTALGASHYLEEALRWIPADGSSAVPEGPAIGEPGSLGFLGEAADRNGADRPRIVLADDNADMRDYVRRLLSDRYDVVALSNGEAALQAIREHVPALVITDVMMPAIDGFGLLKALRDEPSTRTVPVIMLSARAGEESRIEGLEAGADDYLIKPFSARELLARVGSHLELARVRREAAVREHELRREAEASREHANTILESITDGFAAFDAAWRFTYLNPEAERILRTRRGQLLGRSVWTVYPETAGTLLEQELRHSLADQTSVEFEYFHRPWGRWFELRAYPSKDGGITVYFRDISDRRWEEEERERLHRELREKDRRKDEFLAMLAHELRNPLAAITSAVAFTARAPDADQHIGWCTEVVERQAKHLGRLIDDLLDVSRITRGKIQLRTERIDATPILRHALETVHSLIAERQHQLSVSLEPGLWLEADPTRLEQIVANLLSNAAKYTDSGGQIQLDARRQGDEVVIQVKDNGIGIPPEKLPSMFELFAQGDRALARSEGGLGIGLTLVRSLAEMHGGTATAASGGPGQGSTFTVRLPAAREPQPQPQPTAQDRHGQPPALLTRPGTLARRPWRVLVVDDNVDTARGMSRLLRLLGHHVTLAQSGPEALEAARSAVPEFILLDIGLPGMDGYETASRLRQQEQGRDALIVAVSGYGQDEDRRRSKEAGFDEHLVKPVDYDALIALFEHPRGNRSG